MKKINLSIALTLFVFICANSQTILEVPTIQEPINQHLTQERSSAEDTCIWYEDFRYGLGGNNGSADPQWTFSGSDGDIWAYDTDGSNGQYAGQTPYLLTSQSAGNGWMIFDADADNPGIPAQFNAKNGQLISPYIDLSNDTNITLRFEHAFRWCCGSEHELSVGVSIDNGISWNNFIVNDNYVPNELATTHETSIILSDIAGGEDSVLIRFDWGGTEQTASHYYWMIDDVSIIETPAEFAYLVDSYVRFPSTWLGGTFYSTVPLAQAQSTSYFFGGIVENLGVNTLDSARIYGEISSENFAEQSFGATLETEFRDTLFCINGFTPNATGEFIGEIYAMDDNGVTSEIDSIIFGVSEYEYARDRGDFAQAFGRSTINDEGTEIRGNIFDIYQDAEIYSIRVYIDEATSLNAEAKAILHVVTPGQNPAYLYEDETLTVDVGQNTEQWVDFMFNNPYQATAGQVLLATIYAEFTDGLDSVVIGASGISNPGETMLQDVDGVQGDPGTWYYTTQTSMVRLNFDPNAQAPVSVNDIKDISFNVYPNPNNGIFNIEIDNNKKSNFEISVQNTLGQNVYTKELSKITKLNKLMDLSYLEKGVYTITISENDKKYYSQKIVIQ